MLQAIATLVFLAVASLTSGIIGLMLTREWPAIRRALGREIAVVPQPLPPRYRTLPARRATMVRDMEIMRAAA